ncbi:hypothetical protein V6N11_022812 [Hibiscus sabdariffa]|uniref:Uncharacterized protein n=1 Tax=Hibiscus sabdariffa TaxID=183260 RepID=A0ABR2TL59_9ROSI
MPASGPETQRHARMKIMILRIRLDGLQSLLFRPALEAPNRERDESSQGHVCKFKIKSKSDGFCIQHVKLC